MRKTIKTQGDFDKAMNALQNELRGIALPLRQEEDKLKLQIGEWHVRRAEAYIALEKERTHWSEIQEKKGIREEKLNCLAEIRRLKLELSHIGGGISQCKMQLRKIQNERREASQPYHDKMHELIIKYPKGSLPMIAR